MSLNFPTIKFVQHLLYLLLRYVSGVPLVTAAAKSKWRSDPAFQEYTEIVFLVFLAHSYGVSRYTDFSTPPRIPEHRDLTRGNSPGEVVTFSGAEVVTPRVDAPLLGHTTLSIFTPWLISPRFRGLMRGSPPISRTLSSVFRAR